MVSENKIRRLFSRLVLLKSFLLCLLALFWNSDLMTVSWNVAVLQDEIFVSFCSLLFLPVKDTVLAASLLEFDINGQGSVLR